MSRSLLIGAIAFIFGINAVAQNSRGDKPTIVVGRNVLISNDDPTKPHAESFLAISPRDPNLMLATSIVFDKGEDTAAVYLSKDSGSTWQRSASFDSSIPPFSGGDPVVYFDNTGGALFGSIAGMPEGFRVWRSSNGGGSWDSLTRVAGGIYDRQYLVVDRTTGSYSGRVYAAGIITIRKSDGGAYPAVAVAFSTDNGKTFAPAVIVDTTSGGQYFGGGVADLLLTKKGGLVVIFSVTERTGANPTKRYWTMMSTDGGRTFSAIRAGPQVGRNLGSDAYKTLFATHAAIDQSNGPFADRVYLAWIDYANNRYDLKVSYSDDLGMTWSAPVSVNDNTGSGDPSNPAVAVNREGIVSVIFNDQRDDPKNDCYRLYLSASLDGGDTFLPNVQVNPKPTCTNAPGNWAGRIISSLGTSQDRMSRYRSVSILGIPERFPNGGETQGLVAGADGRFHVTWINGESGVMQLWYTNFVVQLEGQSVGTKRVDRTADVRIEASEPVINFDGKSLSFSVKLKNESSTSIPGPLTLQLDQFESGLGGLIAANTDNGLPRKGAIWKFAINGLTPGGVSETRRLDWKFDGKIPDEPKERFRGQFRVFSEISQTGKPQ